MSNIWLAFINGLTTGGLSCLAIQGGLLATTLVTDGKNDRKILRVQKTALFIIAKIMAYMLLGFLLGFLGSKIALSSRIQGIFQIAAGLFLLATAARLLDLHPIFRRFVIQPPKWSYQFSKKISYNPSFFAPVLLGALTVFLPCGITQAMMVLAIASANPWIGAAIMGAFTLGTSPLFFAFGLTATEILKKNTLKVAAALLIALTGILSINTGQILRGSAHTLDNYYRVLFTNPGNSSVTAQVNPEGKQEVVIYVKNDGYQTSTKSLKMGIPVKLILVTNNTRSCSRAFVIPRYNISKILPATGREVVEFTPTVTGTLTYSCSMGMYSGSFQVIQ